MSVISLNISISTDDYVSVAAFAYTMYMIDPLFQ